MNIKGRLDIANRWFIKGWCFDEKSIHKPLSVNIFVNGKFLKSIKANKLRKGLIKNNIHPTGLCGFQHYLADKQQFNIGDKISVRTNNSKLNNSPQLIKKFHLTQKTSNSKIIVIGLGKSGTSKLTYVIKAGMHPDTEVFFEPKGALGLEDIKQHKEICESTDVIHKSLFLMGKEINFDIISELYDKKVWILRDPRDRIISLMLYRWFRGHNPNPEKFQKALELVRKKEDNPASVNIIDIWHLVIPAHKFEDRMKYEIETLDNVLSNLDASYHILSYTDLVEGNMENLEKYLEFKVSIEEEIPNSLSRVARSKSSGNWKNWFTQKDVEFFKPIFQPFIQKYNLCEDDWTLNDNPAIDPNKGSDYMLKIFNPK